MEQNSPIRKGTESTLSTLCAGEPGHGMRFDHGKSDRLLAVTFRNSAGKPRHAIDTLVIDEAFTVRQLGLDFESQAA